MKLFLVLVGLLGLVLTFTGDLNSTYIEFIDEDSKNTTDSLGGSNGFNQGVRGSLLPKSSVNGSMSNVVEVPISRSSDIFLSLVPKKDTPIDWELPSERVQFVWTYVPGSQVDNNGTTSSIFPEGQGVLIFDVIGNLGKVNSENSTDNASV
jgi:hypothetical protein